jgi:preprotein translocase subunit YajC
MFESPAYAASGASGAGAGAFGLVGLLPWVAIFVIFYFLLIRPQQRRARQHQQMIGAVKKNDVAVTAGGVIGKVTKVEDSEVELEIASGVRVKVIKGTLSEVRPHGTRPAND